MVLSMATLTYDTFIDTIFSVNALSRQIQHRIETDLRDPPYDETEESSSISYAKTLLGKALLKGYSIMSRFMPPYYATVTFYKDTVGFVIVSRLGPDFDESVTEIKILDHKRNKHKFKSVSVGAVDTIVQAYSNIKKSKNSKKIANKRGGQIKDVRNKEAHETALKYRDKNCHRNSLKGFSNNEMFIRLERVRAEKHPVPRIKYIPNYRSVGTHSNVHFYIWQPCVRVGRLFIEQLRLLAHPLFFSSNIDFQKGPAAVRNNYLYETHNGSYAGKVSVIEGELSSRLNLWVE